MSPVDHARLLDERDPLRPFRARFYPPPDGAIYLDGNSLGLLSRDAEAAVLGALDEWKTRAIGGWLDAGWLSRSERVAARLAPLVGAEVDEVAVTNSATVNLHQALATLFRPVGERRRILAFAGDFPSDLFAIRSFLRGRGLDPAECLTLLPPAGDRLLDHDVAVRALADPTVALAVLPAVVYTTGELLDTARLAAAARGAGVVIGFDLSHSVGVVAHRLSADGADFAVWCHYKYLNAGPGAVGGLYLNRRHHGRAAPGLAGWWGSRKERMFDPGVAARGDLEPAAGAGGLQIGTPSMLSLAAMDGALAISEEAGIGRIRAKSLALTSYLMGRIEAELPAGDAGSSGVTFANPREDARRGGHVALVHPAADRLCRALRAAGVVADHRPPDILRLAPSPLYNGFEDCYEAAARLRRILANREHERLPEERSLVP